jgi:cobalt-precorrin-5B (C1)-methyltransferase
MNRAGSNAADYRKILNTAGGLRRGITSGTCAQAAAKAAALILTTGRESEVVEITLPAGKKPYSGKKIRIPVALQKRSGNSAIAGILKDAGDDKDITNGVTVVAHVRFTEKPGITIRGGEGVGRVTRPGLSVKVGESAINPVPRKQIKNELAPLVPEGMGMEVILSVPGGEELAKKTWNPRLGIVGGISIIGTSGVVEPKSAKAFKTSIGLMVKAAVENGIRSLIITPGYVGESFLYEKQRVPEDYVVTVGDHIGFTLKVCAARKCSRIFLVGHIGKMVKLAAGIFDTHSKYGDARLETIAAWAGACGASRETIQKILSLELAEAAIEILEENELEETFSRIAAKVVKRSEIFVQGMLDVGCVLLSLEGKVLASIPNDFCGEMGWKKYLL